jgi:hypothetical protein
MSQHRISQAKEADKLTTFKFALFTIAQVSQNIAIYSVIFKVFSSNYPVYSYSELTGKGKVTIDYNSAPRR